MESSSSEHTTQQPLLQLQLPNTNPDTTSNLENTLLDDNLTLFGRMSKATWLESKILFRLAAPTVIVYMINYLMSMSTQIFSGHLGATSNLPPPPSETPESKCSLMVYW
ncbi:hypothetical protein V6N11_021206 [Hibiscus sabdariffa]|uniref:Uncharacterized protein n=2 Tax=Hibiscus sabdariffa TaxID=183260 RepID=A0ABR2A7D0_9ROSI